MDKFASHLHFCQAKMLSASGASPSDYLTRGSVPGPRWELGPQTSVIDSRSAFAMSYFEEVIHLFIYGFEPGLRNTKQKTNRLLKLL